jgi:hypothetical protein
LYLRGVVSVRKQEVCCRVYSVQPLDHVQCHMNPIPLPVKCFLIILILINPCSILYILLKICATSWFFNIKHPLLILYFLVVSLQDFRPTLSC